MNNIQQIDINVKSLQNQKTQRNNWFPSNQLEKNIPAIAIQKK